MERHRLGLVLATFLLCAGCGGPVQRGCDLYANGRYIDAALVFERTEPRLHKIPPAERARYGLYRGATLHSLGDLEGAQKWLRYAKRTHEKAPESLDPDEARHLDRALDAVEGELRKLAHRQATQVKRAGLEAETRSGAADPNASRRALGSP